MGDINDAIRKAEDRLEKTETKITFVESQIDMVDIQKLRTLLNQPLASWEDYERGEYRDTDHIFDVALPYLWDKEKALSDKE